MRRLSVLLIVTAVLGACRQESVAPTRVPDATAPVQTGSPALGRGTARITTEDGVVDVRVEIASTQSARERGLMGRTELAADAGMVFLFETESVRSFWMKDTLIPLSIAYFDQEGRIVAILDMEPCRTLTCDLYPSGRPASGALEVNQGFFAEHGVRVGDRITVEVETP